jgi:HTH-type transcriptional regulator / antitoxin HigA
MDERSTADWFSKPGDSIRVMMQRRGVSSAELANTLEAGMNTLRAIYDGTRAIDETLANVLSSSLGGSKAFWLKRQENFETALARAVDAAAKNESDAWLRLVPSPSGGKAPPKMTESRLHEELRGRLVYFNVPKLDAWERRYGETIGATRFRTSRHSPLPRRPSCYGCVAERWRLNWPPRENGNRAASRTALAPFAS